MTSLLHKHCPPAPAIIQCLHQLQHQKAKWSQKYNEDLQQLRDMEEAARVSADPNALQRRKFAMLLLGRTWQHQVRVDKSMAAGALRQ
jgi:hypothetical protein